VWRSCWRDLASGGVVTSVRDRGGARGGVGSSEKKQRRMERKWKASPGARFSPLSHAQRWMSWHTTRARENHAATRVWHRSAVANFKF
jgi:hypothetical protein